jgi:hypothetical protein
MQLASGYMRQFISNEIKIEILDLKVACPSVIVATPLREIWAASSFDSVLNRWLSVIRFLKPMAGSTKREFGLSVWLHYAARVL